MEILALVMKVVNYVLYSAFTWIDAIFNAFGLSWLGVVVGLAVMSVVLRLFAANLIGSAISLHKSREKASDEQYVEQQKARRSIGRGASKSGHFSRRR